MSAEVVQVVSKSASLFARLKDIATAHPVGTAVAGTVVTGLAVVGTYKIMKGVFGKSPEKVEVTVKTEKAEEAK